MKKVKINKSGYLKINHKEWVSCWQKKEPCHINCAACIINNNKVFCIALPVQFNLEGVYADSQQIAEIEEG